MFDFWHAYYKRVDLENIVRGLDKTRNEARSKSIRIRAKNRRRK